MLDFDFREPDYVAVFRQRLDLLQRIRTTPGAIAIMKVFYRDNPIQFIQDWGTTADPRNVELGRPVVVPFVLFPRQVELCQWILDSWRAGRPGVCKKSRDVGASWCAMALAITLGIFNNDMSIGFGSRKAELVDKSGDPKSLFHKGRQFLELLPVEFRGGYSSKHAPYMRISLPETNSNITGEAGDNIGRGGRTGIYFVDESAHLERPVLVDAALAANTNCRIDLSSVNGADNPFANKCQSWPPERVFEFHWRADPRKDDAWYEQKKIDIDNPVLMAQEYDLDFNASKEGVLIPSTWVQACVDAHRKLGIDGTGAKVSSLDVADEGKDLNAYAHREGIVLKFLESWSGKGDDIFGTVERAFNLSDELGTAGFRYDADGVGAGVRGDARVINERRADNTQLILNVEPFRGSGEVIDPEAQVFKADGKSNGRTNEDYYANRKAQGWWSLRVRCQRTFRWVTEGIPCDPDELISFDPACPELTRAMQELSQPTYYLNGAGKIIVDKAPEGMRSPNLADAIMYAFAPHKVRRGVFD